MREPPGKVASLSVALLIGLAAAGTDEGFAQGMAGVNHPFEGGPALILPKVGGGTLSCTGPAPPNPGWDDGMTTGD